jgi:hypothetical protein
MIRIVAANVCAGDGEICGFQQMSRLGSYCERQAYYTKRMMIKEERSVIT